MLSGAYNACVSGPASRVYVRVPKTRPPSVGSIVGFLPRFAQSSSSIVPILGLAREQAPLDPSGGLAATAGFCQLMQRIFRP